MNPNCYLREEQKNLLRSLVPGLKDGSVKSEWSYAFGGEKIWMINGLGSDGKLWREHWQGIVKRSDFDAFVNCGYFLEHSDTRLALNEGAIIHAVETNFGEDNRRTQESRIVDTEAMQREFLETIARAYPDFLTKKNSTGDYYIRLIYSTDGTQIVDVDGFHDEFYPAVKDSLTIPMSEFVKMTPTYFSKARGKGNYYINMEAIQAFVKGDEADFDQPIFSHIATEAQFQCDIFMVMPFREHLDPIYHDHIKKVASELGLDIKRGDDPFSRHDIITEIWSLINNCQVVIADCTGKNPNVFYEMGLAHAIGKPVISITQNADDIPFDIRQRRYIEYTYTPRGIAVFEKDLKRKIQLILGRE